MSKTNRSNRDVGESPPPLAWWRQRGFVLLAGVVALLMLLVMMSGKSSAVVLAMVCSDGVLLLLWLAAAGGWGSWIPVGATPASPLQIVTHVALGLGIISLLELLLGLAGLLHRPIAFAIIAIGIALLVIRVHKHIAQWLTAPADWDWLWLLGTPLLAAGVVAALVPPGILWGDEPHAYDVLEYHLQLPREWLELGRIAPLQHNVFSYFPLNVEMHYLLAMQLKGGPWAGMYLAQLMHLAMIALTALAVYAVARTFASKPAAILAALAALSTPWMLMLGSIAYNEGGLLLFGTLAIAWLLHSLSLRERAGVRASVIAGLFAGFACGTKLTGVALLLIIAPPIRREQPIKQLATFVIAGVVTFSPWLIRNTIWAGNPVFPEATSIFGRAHFTETQVERWKRAHSPTESQRSIRGRASAAWNQIARDFRFGYALLPAGLLAMLITIRRRESQVLLSLLIAWLIVWLAFTHLQGRFFVLAIPIAAIALARFPVAAAVPLIAGMIVSLNLFTTRVAPLADKQVLGAEDFKPMLADDVQLFMEKKDADFVLVGDAKAFLYQIPTQRLRYRTVFDVQNSPGDSVMHAWLGEQSGSPYIVVDPFELERFSRTYYAIPPLGGDFPAPRDRITVLMPAGSR